MGMLVHMISEYLTWSETTKVWSTVAVSLHSHQQRMRIPVALLYSSWLWSGLWSWDLALLHARTLTRVSRTEAGPRVTSAQESAPWTSFSSPMNVWVLLESQCTPSTGWPLPHPCTGFAFWSVLFGCHCLSLSLCKVLCSALPYS